MTYSTLIDQKKPPQKQSYGNKYSSRGGTKVSRVIVHHWAGTAGGVERLVYSADKASANYIILSDGTIIGSVPEEFRAWTSSSAAADRPSITVEVQNAETKNYTITDAAENALIRLIADVATRHGFVPKAGTTLKGHRDFAATSCPGPYLYPRLAAIAAAAMALMQGGTTATVPTASSTATTAKVAEWPNAALYVDGVFGPMTTKAYQRLLVPASVGNYTGPIDGDFGKASTSAEQRWLRKLGYYKGAMDGVRGPVTRKALQSFLKAKGYYRGPIDGDLGNASIKALQNYLNDQAQYYK